MAVLRETRTRVVTFVALVLAFGFVLGGLTPASGQTGGETGPLPDGGVLRLRLGAEDHFRYEPPTGPASTQSVGVSTGCRLALGSSPTLVSLSAGPGNAVPGFVSNAIGVRGSGSDSNGQPCGRIDPGQSLTLTLAQSAGAVLADEMIDFAELDIEGKFSVTFKIDGYAVDSSGATLVTSETYDTTGSDSGPDSGDGDNYRVRFPKSGTTMVNRLVISIVGPSGAVSLEGGSDGTGPCDAADGCTEGSLGQTLETTDSLFHLVQTDGLLDCDDNSAGTGGATQGGDGTPLTTIERFENADGSECEPIAFNQDSDTGEEEFCNLVETPFSQCILFQKDLLEQDAQFLWTVVWVAEDGEYPETATQFDFGEGFQDLQLCLANDDEGEDPVLPELPPTADPEDPSDALDPWCVASSSIQLDFETGSVIVTETYYGRGDPTGRR
jgi:hypothetical protein